MFEYPSGAQGLRRKKQDDEEPNPEPENVTSQGSSVSALDVWRDTLINAASAEKGRNVGSTIENLLCQQECKIQTRTLQLWQQLRAEDRRQKSGKILQYNTCVLFCTLTMAFSRHPISSKRSQKGAEKVEEEVGAPFGASRT